MAFSWGAPQALWLFEEVVGTKGCEEMAYGSFEVCLACQSAWLGMLGAQRGYILLNLEVALLCSE